METEHRFRLDGPSRRDLEDNLRVGLRLAAFLPVSASNVRATWSQLAALVGIQLAIMLFCDLAAAEFGGAPNIFGLPGAMFGLVLALTAAWALAVLSGRSDRTLLLLVAFCALSVPLELIFQLFAHTPLVQQIGYRGLGASVVYSLPSYWLALAAGVGAARLLPLSTLRRFAAIALSVAVWGVPSAFIYRDADLWRRSYGAEEQAAFQRRYMALNQEDVFYLQPRLLEQALSAIKPGRQGRIDLYFVGVAGWAMQDVFMKEVNSVGKLFEERFAAQGRTVRLINNPKSVADAPIASVTSLQRALRQIAGVMDRDEDILFLFLTSHGSQEHRFSLDFGAMKFNDLTPARLKELLDETGIKRRVIVVSACYSGGFIEALKDDSSLIITASAPDKNSFGCSNQAEFTYFGKAYFDEALRQTYSFIDAFDIAKPRIAEREKKSDYTHSDPQIFVGEGIRGPLAEVESTLRDGVRAPAQAKAPARDRYGELADIWIVPDLIRRYRDECLRNMAKVSPARYVEKDPGYYGGVGPSSPLWPRLMGAWNVYAEEYCAATNDAKMYTRLYEQGLRDALDRGSVDAALRFFRTPVGRRFVEGSTGATIHLTATLLSESAPATDRATSRFSEEQVRINRDFQREQGAKR